MEKQGEQEVLIALAVAKSLIDLHWIDCSNSKGKGGGVDHHYDEGEEDEYIHDERDKWGKPRSG